MAYLATSRAVFMAYLATSRAVFIAYLATSRAVFMAYMITSNTTEHSRIIDKVFILHLETSRKCFVIIEYFRYMYGTPCSNQLQSYRREPCNSRQCQRNFTEIAIYEGENDR